MLMAFPRRCGGTRRGRKARATAAEEEESRTPGNSPKKPPAIRGSGRLAAEALETERARTQEVREALSVLEEQAAPYWNKTDTSKEPRR